MFFDGCYSEIILDDNLDFVMLVKVFNIFGKIISCKEEVEFVLCEMLVSKIVYLLYVLIDEEENVWLLVLLGVFNIDMFENI